jgi:hypothetical protein
MNKAKAKDKIYTGVFPIFLSPLEFVFLFLILFFSQEFWPFTFSNMLTRLIWTQDTCNSMPNFELTWNPIGSGMVYDPLNPGAPVMKGPEPM